MNIRSWTSACSSLAVMAAVALLSGSALADTFVWTNASGDGKWTTLDNWTVGGVKAAVYPDAVDAVVSFSPGDWTVTLDTGTETKFANITKYNAGVATINGTPGSALRPSNATAGTGEAFCTGSTAVTAAVTDGTKLVVNVPVVSSIRVDKWFSGAVVFTQPFTSSMTPGNFSFIANGLTTFSGNHAFVFPGLFGSGNGEPQNISGGGEFLTRFADGAQVTINTLQAPTRGKNTETIGFEQDGADTVVNITALTFPAEKANTFPTYYRVKDGTLNVGSIVLDGNAKASIIQDGGTVKLTGALTVTGACDGYVLNGGTFVNANPDTLNFANFFANFHVRGPATFRNEGGRVMIDKDIALSGTLDIAKGEVVVGKGKAVDGEDVTISAMENDYTPLKVNIAKDAKLRFVNIASRISRPLDLSIAAGGKVCFPKGEKSEFLNRQTHARGMLIAHKLTLDGVEQKKGVYGTSDYFDAYAASQIVVPYVWTGAAGDGLWDTPENWEGGVLPPGGSESTFVDLSAAEGQTIRIVKDVGYAIGGVIANPCGGTRKVTLTGSSLTLRPPYSFGTSIYVGKGCTLDFDIDVQRSVGSFDTMAKMLGGGTVVFRRGYPDSGTSNGTPRLSPLVPDGTFVFAGEVTPIGGDNQKIFSLGGNAEQYDGYGVLKIIDGARVTAKEIMFSNSQVSPIAEVRQTGGIVTAEEINLSRRQPWAKDKWPFAWYLEGGEINLSKALRLGVNTMAQNDVRPGMDFDMYGGVLRTPQIATRCNTNLLRLYDGDIYLGAGGIVRDNSVVLEYVPNVSDLHAYFGGIRIHATDSWSSDINITLHSVMGDPEFDTAGHSVALNGSLIGAGGFVKTGLGTLTVNNATNTFSGAVRVKAGSVVFGEKAKLTAIQSLTVEEGASVTIDGAVSAKLASVMLVDGDSLTLASGAGFTTSLLLVGGESKPAGSYAFGAGTVTVAPPAGVVVYVGGDNGSWSAAGSWANEAAPAANGSVDFGYSTLPQDCTIKLDSAVTLSALSYRRAGGGTLTLDAAGGSLTFPSGSAITVDEGCTLVVNADVTIASAAGQSVYRKGSGTLIFNGKVTGPTANAVSFFYLDGGETCFNGVTSRMRIMQEFTTYGEPITRLGEGCVADDYAMFQLCWGNNLTKGTIIQDGGTYDLSKSAFGGFTYNWLSRNAFLGRYVLNGGLFKTSAKVPNGFDYTNLGNLKPRIEFEQNGGTSILQRFCFGQFSNELNTYTLNDGLMSFPTAPEPGESKVVVNLNGGTVSSAYSGLLFQSAMQPLEVHLGGRTTFEQATAADEVCFTVDLTGAGDLVQAGPGTLELCSGASGLADVSVTGGALTLSAPSAATNYVVASGAALHVASARAFAPNACLNLAEGATVTIDGEGVTTVYRATYGKFPVLRGTYGAGTGVPLPEGFTGAGTLHVRKGSAGMIMLVR